MTVEAIEELKSYPFPPKLEFDLITMVYNYWPESTSNISWVSLKENFLSKEAADILDELKSCNYDKLNNEKFERGERLLNIFHWTHIDTIRGFEAFEKMKSKTKLYGLYIWCFYIDDLKCTRSIKACRKNIKK